MLFAVVRFYALACVFVLFIGFTSCMTPVVNEEEKIDPELEEVLDLMNVATYFGFSASPVQEELAVVANEYLFNLLALDREVTSGNKVIGENLHQIKNGLIPKLAPGCQKIASYFDGKLNVSNFSKNKTTTFEIQFIDFKWTASDTKITYLTKDPETEGEFKIFLLDLQDGSQTLLSKLEGEMVTTYHYNPFKEMLISCVYVTTDDGPAIKVDFMDFQTNTNYSLFLNNYVNEIAISNDGKQLALIDNYIKKLIIFNGESTELTGNIDLQEVLFSPYWNNDNQTILFSFTTGYAVYSVLTQELEYFKLDDIDETILDKVWHNDQKTICMLDRDKKNTLSVYDLQSKNRVFRKEISGTPQGRVLWFSGGQKLLYSDSDKIKELDLATGYESDLFESDQPAMDDISLSENDQWVAYVKNTDGKESTIVLRDILNNTSHEVLLEEDGFLKNIVWMNNNQRLSAYFSDKRKLLIYRFNGHALIEEERIDYLSLEHLVWAPETSSARTRLGDYALLMNQQNLSIYSLPTNSIYHISDITVNNPAAINWDEFGSKVYFTIDPIKKIFRNKIVHVFD